MYVETPEAAVSLVKELKSKMRSLSHVEVALAPSFVLLPTVADVLSRSTIAFGAQALSSHHDPAHTGEVSARMLKNVGATFTIIGHSERRALGETNEVVRTQILEATSVGLGVVLCVGEKERDAGGEHFAFIKEQLTSALTNFPAKSVSKLVVAYEPVWAIGKHASDAMKPQEVQETTIFIRKTLTGLLEPTAAKKVTIIYGGSVEAENASSLIKEGGVGGFLVGHASASIETFLPILKAVR